MEIFDIIRCGVGLAQLRKLCFEICQSVLEYLTMLRMACYFQLLQDVAASQYQALLPAFLRKLFRRQGRARLLDGGGGFGLLFFDGLTFPPPGHAAMIAAKKRDFPNPHCKENKLWLKLAGVKNNISCINGELSYNAANSHGQVLREGEQYLLAPANGP